MFSLPQIVLSPRTIVISWTIGVAVIIVAVIGLSSGLILSSGSKAEASVPAASAMCGERASIIRTLEDDYQENRQSRGMSANGAVVELYTSVGGSWTILLTRPDGSACLVATGDNWGSTPRLGGDKAI